MTEEEYFRKNYPDACYYDKPLSPYWDYFQFGVEFGERESEDKILELKDELKKWKDEWQEQVQKANDEGYARTLQTMQLTKAKEIISEWEDSFCCGTDYLYLGNKGKELRIKSQNFLNSEVEK